MTDERDPIHDLLEEAAQHRLREMRSGRTICWTCYEEWPCLVTKLSAELHALRKESRTTTPCVCG